MNHTSTDSARPDKETGKRTPRQIGALLCIVLLVAMYLLTLAAACMDFPGWGRLFAGCLLMTIALPILLWIYIWLYGVYTKKHTLASLDMLHSDESAGTDSAPGEDASGQKADAG